LKVAKSGNHIRKASLGGTSRCSKNTPPLERIEKEAKVAKKGLLEDATPVAPQILRKQKRKG
jgi:hypothetical protein